jgi:hypothetical protein
MRKPWHAGRDSNPRPSGSKPDALAPSAVGFPREPMRSGEANDLATQTRASRVVTWRRLAVVVRTRIAEFLSAHRFLRRFRLSLRSWRSFAHRKAAPTEREPLPKHAQNANPVWRKWLICQRGGALQHPFESRWKRQFSPAESGSRRRANPPPDRSSPATVGTRAVLPLDLRNMGKPEPELDAEGPELEVRSLDIVADRAVATVESTLVGTQFTSHLSLIRHRGDWQIVNGLFHSESNGSPGREASCGPRASCAGQEPG